MVPSQCPCVWGSGIEFDIWTGIIAPCSTVKARWLGTWNSRFDSDTIASPSVSQEHWGGTFFERGDALADFYYHPGTFMTEAMVCADHHCLPNTSMFPEMNITVWSEKAASTRANLPQMPVALTWTMTSSSFGSGISVSTTRRS